MANGLAKSVEPFFEKVEKLSKVQRLAISAALFGLIAGGFIYFLYWPKLEQINRLNTDLEKLEKKLETAKRNAKDLKKLQAKMQEAEAQFQMAMKKLPEKEEIPSLLSSISSSGQEVGLEFLLFEPKPEKKKEFYAEIPVAMNIKGDYHNLALFFDQVARLSRIVNIQNIQIAKAKGTGTTGTRELSTKCMAVTYKFIEASARKSKKKRKKKKK
ncbi:Type IV pilus biogenesis protein PilO [Olavius sp. associated proteobacterium Delta 1]|nr:Type IV pilus biogenesis protein PilO [Olavius sp. associated proteobacterium Delta 1]